MAGPPPPQPPAAHGHPHAPPGAAQPPGPPGAGRSMDPRIQQQQELVRKRLADIGRVVIVMSGKGGVGKSTIAAALAVRLAERGRRVGLLDMDLTGPDLPKFLDAEDANIGDSKTGMRPSEVRPGLFLMSLAYLLPDKDAAIVWRGPMKMGAIRQLITEVDWGTLDHLIIDLPPGTSDEPLSIAQNIPDADGVILVTTPHSISILDVKKSLGFARQLGLHVLGVVENMSGLECPHCHHAINVFGSGLGKELAQDAGVPFLGAVPIDPDAAGDGGRMAIPAPLRKGSPAGPAFLHIVDNVEKALAARPPRPRPPPGLGALRMA